jgi:hypothetical protein
MPLIIIAVLLYLAYRFEKARRSGAATATAPKAVTGSRTAAVGGSSLPGNSFDSGNAMTLGPEGPCDSASDPKTLTYATCGGENGGSPVASSPPLSPSGVVSGRGWVAPDKSPPAQTSTPVNVTAASATNKRRFVRGN